MSGELYMSLVVLSVAVVAFVGAFTWGGLRPESWKRTADGDFLIFGVKRSWWFHKEIFCARGAGTVWRSFPDGARYGTLHESAFTDLAQHALWSEKDEGRF